MKYKNYGVVVTGGGHGIGKAIIEEFVREGAKVCFIDINGIIFFFQIVVRYNT